MDINDRTNKYKKFNTGKYVIRGLKYVPPGDLRNIHCIDVYDSAPSHFPVGIRGGHYIPNKDRGSVIDLYIEAVMHYMLAVHEKQNILTGFLDMIFLSTYGKLFIESVLFHEIGHHVYHIANDKEDDNIKSEEFANKYELDIYGKMHPALLAAYEYHNKFYHDIYKIRIAKADAIKTKIINGGLTTA